MPYEISKPALMEAVAFLEEWSNDDHEMRVPSNAWGSLMVYYVDLIIQNEKKVLDIKD